MVADGTICDAKTICLIHRYRGDEPCASSLLPAASPFLWYLPLAPAAPDSTTPSYSVDSNGVLSVTCAPVTTNETVIFSNATYTESKIIMHTQTGDVVTYLSYPEHPKAVILYAAGRRGENLRARRADGHLCSGRVCLPLSRLPGPGRETAGYPLNPQTDYALFENREWPEYYLTICDISSAQAMLPAPVQCPGVCGRGE